ncbi:MAG: TusE/DsrC/DsvC family sulfur relay protein [Thermoanaerobaculia bacterium]
MPACRYDGHNVETNPEGFLLDSSQWTPELAEVLARDSGIALGERHWKVLSFCREDTAREGQPPGLRRIAKLSGVDMKELYQLFPKGPGKLAARIAGLPKPQGCV